MSGVAALFGQSQVVNKNGEQVDLAKHCAGKTVGIYFSAHWCPPCRGFTPVLTEFYNAYKESKNFEIIFVSSDRTDAAFIEYYNEMPWLGLVYSDRDKKSELATKYEIKGIPTLVLINADTGELITSDGRSGVQFDDPKGVNFPWKS